MTGHGDQARLGRVLELLVTAPGPGEIPAIVRQEAEEIPGLSWRKDDAARASEQGQENAACGGCARGTGTQAGVAA